MRIVHHLLVGKRHNCKLQPELKYLLVSFIPTILQIWPLYIWCWCLLALWVALKAMQQRSRQAPAVTKVCTFIVFANLFLGFDLQVAHKGPIETCL